MILTTVLLFVVLAGASCRWVAYSKRVAMPRRFSFRERGFWFPPWPAPGEFATSTGRRLEVSGRILINVAVSLQLIERILGRVSRW